MNAMVKAAIEQSPIAQQALAAKKGINQLTTAIPDAVQGVKNAVGEQLEAQKEAVKGIVDERIAAAGLPAPGNVSMEGENEPTEPAEGEENAEASNEVEEGNAEEEAYEGGARRRRHSRKPRKISRKGIRQMASRRGSRRATRRRASRKGRRASRKAQRK